MFEDEAGFGRISRPAHCWCPKGVRPVVSSLQVREYEYSYGAVEPKTGDSHFLILPRANTVCMNVFLKSLSLEFPNSLILLCMDGASWHTSGGLEKPENIRVFYIPPFTPEMNPIEQVWKEIRKRAFKNRFFKSLDKVIDQLCLAIQSLSKATIKSVTGRDWCCL